jgi:hypothetical protein
VEAASIETIASQAIMEDVECIHRGYEKYKYDLGKRLIGR